jgi:hypothetical protein
MTVVYAIINENYATVPFLLLRWGYLHTGSMSLGQTYFARLSASTHRMRPATSGAPAFDNFVLRRDAAQAESAARSNSLKHFFQNGLRCTQWPQVRRTGQ